MSIFRLSIKNILSRPLSSLLSIVLIAFGIGIISLLIIIDHQMQEKLEKNVAGIDLVVGAKGSPMQLVLSSLYHIDYPTGNIDLEEAQKLMKHPGVKTAIPLALGDNYRSYRIVGTNEAYIPHYGGELAEGNVWQQSYEVVIGAKLQQETGLKIGSYFHGSHGLHDEGHSHDHVDYKVVGILKPTGTVIDQLILTSVESVWEIHASESPEASSELTSLLIQTSRPMDKLTLPGFINQNTNMQAASPAFEIARLFSLMGSAYTLLRYLAFAIMLISGFSIFISLFNALQQRKYEIAIIRTLGGTRAQTLLLVLLEGFIIALVGCIIGIVFSHTMMLFVSEVASDNYNYSFHATTFYREESFLFLLAMGVGILASLLPAIQAYKTDISSTLTES